MLDARCPRAWSLIRNTTPTQILMQGGPLRQRPRAGSFASPPGWRNSVADAISAEPPGGPDRERDDERQDEVADQEGQPAAAPLLRGIAGGEPNNFADTPAAERYPSADRAPPP